MLAIKVYLTHAPSTKAKAEGQHVIQETLQKNT